jgi:type IV pilus assembly protein PilO
MSFVDELNNLDYSNPGGWPIWVKLGSVILLMIAICAAGFYGIIQNQTIELNDLEKIEQDRKTEFRVKQQKAAQLPAYKSQLEEMKVILNSMLRQLPSKNEMSDLIVDVSQTALASGIDNELFEPGTEVLKDFYAEKPISLKMVGKYHQFGEFVSGVASLPRVVILTMHDISLKPINGIDGNTLLLEGTARTYRYLDDEEQAAINLAAEASKPKPKQLVEYKKKGH